MDFAWLQKPTGSCQTTSGSWSTALSRYQGNFAAMRLVEASEEPQILEVGGTASLCAGSSHPTRPLDQRASLGHRFGPFRARKQRRGLAQPLRLHPLKSAHVQGCSWVHLKRPRTPAEPHHPARARLDTQVGTFSISQHSPRYFWGIDSLLL